MNLPANRPVIVAAVDATSLTDEILRTSTALARTMSAELHLIHAIEFMPVPEAPMATTPTEFVDRGRELLNRVTETIRAEWPGRVIGHLAVGKAWREILQCAADVEADMVVVGSHGKRAVERFLMGSVSEQVVRKAHCPVLVVRPKEYVADVPEIEPPCPDCIAARRESAGRFMWCAKHGPKHATHAHLHYESPASFGVGSMFIRPEE